MSRPLRVLDLFSGIGGFSLGLERTGGFKTVAFCEIEPFPRKVLAKHWPDVPCYEDVRTLTAERLAADGIAVDVICGGFPCQDISLAGRQAGITENSRSGLWAEIARLVGELRPRFLIVENVAALLGDGMGRVLGDLAAVGYDAEWHCIPASALGAPHRRDRVWCVAGDANREHIGSGEGDCAGSDPDLARLEKWEGKDPGGARPRLRPIIERSIWWQSEPDVGRVANGVPARVDRLKALGNAVVPQIPELIGRAILEAVAA